MLTSCKDSRVWPPDLYFMKPFPVSSSLQFHNRRKTAVLSRSRRKEKERVEEVGERLENGEPSVLHLSSMSPQYSTILMESGTRRAYVMPDSTVELTVVRKTPQTELWLHTKAHITQQISTAKSWITSFRVTSSAWQGTKDQGKTTLFVVHRAKTTCKTRRSYLKANSHSCWSSWLWTVLETEMYKSGDKSIVWSSTIWNLVKHPFAHITAYTRQQKAL